MQSPNISSRDTSSSSSASSVLIHATTLQRPNGAESKKEHDTSGSSFTSTNSQKVRIKAKYLKEIKSPFEVDQIGGKQPHSVDDGYVPPALPGNRPKGYVGMQDAADVSRHRLEASEDGQKESGDGGKHGNGGHKSREADDSASSALLDAVNTSGQTSKDPVDAVKLGPSTVFRVSSSSLVKQGAPISGNTMQAHLPPAGIGNNLRITQFAPTGRQRIVKEQLLKRQEQSGPVKRFVQPKMVTSQQPLPSSQEVPEHNALGAMGSSTSVAAATAAAVAAAAPIVKAQSDLEYKMNAIMEKLSSMQESRHQSEAHPAAASETYGQLHEMQSRLDEVTQLRLKQLERMQEQQMEWQTKMLSSSQPFQVNQVPLLHQTQQVTKPIPSNTRVNVPQSVQSAYGQPQDLAGNVIAVTPVSQDGGTQRSTERAALPHGHAQSPSVDIVPETQRGLHHRTVKSHPISSHRDTTHQGRSTHGISKRNPKQTPIRKHVKYTPAVTLHRQESPRGGTLIEGDWKEKPRVGMEHGTQTSPLDTPAPRRHAPVPLSQDPPRISHLGRGLLEEILTSHDEEERDNQARNTYSAFNTAGRTDRITPHR